MAQDPDQAHDPEQDQLGGEAQANDISMDSQSTEIDVAVGQYLNMKEGIDHRIAAYSISRQELLKKRPRSLVKWAKDHCESVMKLIQQKPTKEEKVELLIVAIKKQRVLDLKLLKLCRDGSIASGVPENLLPWNYGELEDPESIGKDNKDKDKSPGAADNNGKDDKNDKSGNKKGNGNGNGNDNGQGNGNDNKDNRSMREQIDAAIANLERLKAKAGGNTINNDQDDSKNNQDIQSKNKKLKRDLVNRFKGLNQVKAKHVS